MKKIKKRNGSLEEFNGEKIKRAIEKSSRRIMSTLTEDQKNDIVNRVFNKLYENSITPVEQVHIYVEKALDEVNKNVAKSYRDYRNYKMEYDYTLLNDIEKQVKNTLDGVDRENSNSNTRYISTKRTEIAQLFAKEMYQKLILSKDVISAIKDGYIYIHDLKDLLLRQYNCCLSDITSILKGGFELEGVFYTEPKDIRTAIGQIGDIIMIISAQHFGGFTAPQMDKIIAPYYKMTIDKLTERYKSFGVSDYGTLAKNDAYNELKQSLQGLEIKLNTVVNARGSFPFTTFTFGDVDNAYEADVVKALLEVRMEGHGKKGFKKQLIFPKLVFLYDKEKHDEGKEYSYLFDISAKCSSKCMYPDYIGSFHKRHGKWVSPMGCRAYLSDYFDEKTGEAVYLGRFNIGI